MKIKLSRKQILFLKLLDDPQIVDVLFGGGAGGAKSLTVCLWMVLECRNYPGIRIGLGRKELTRLKQTTLVTLLNEAHPLLGVNKGEFNYQEHKGLITYINGSSIQLVDLARMPSDPDYDRFGSLNFTHVVVEESGEVVKKARDVFISRKNRYLNREFGIVGKSISTCNPSQNYLKSEYYKPYKKLGGGEYQKWEHGKVEVNGEMMTGYRAFVRSLASDNPFLPRNYVEVLRKLPPAERKRLLEGDWDFADDDHMIFKSSLIGRSMTDRIVEGKRVIGVDIADTGSDHTVLTLIEGNVIVEQKKIVVDKSEAIGEQIALEIIKFAQQNGIKDSDIGIDAIGVGASTRDFLRSKGWRVREFIAGASSDSNFKNMRGEVIWGMSQAMDRGDLKIYEKLETLDTLREQLMAHEYSTEERIILVKSKQKIKEVLGASPDYAESAYIAFWVGFGDNDPRKNTRRIIYE